MGSQARSNSQTPTASTIYEEAESQSSYLDDMFRTSQGGRPVTQNSISSIGQGPLRSSYSMAYDSPVDRAMNTPLQQQEGLKAELPHDFLFQHGTDDTMPSIRIFHIFPKGKITIIVISCRKFPFIFF